MVGVVERRPVAMEGANMRRKSQGTQSVTLSCMYPQSNAAEAGSKSTVCPVPSIR